MIPGTPTTELCRCGAQPCEASCYLKLCAACYATRLIKEGREDDGDQGPIMFDDEEDDDSPEFEDDDEDESFLDDDEDESFLDDDEEDGEFDDDDDSL